MGTVTQEYKFDIFSIQFGKFVIACDECEIIPKEYLRNHEYTKITVTIESTSEVATILKLQFGDNLVIHNEEKLRIQLLKARADMNCDARWDLSWLNNTWGDIDDK